MYLLEKLVQVVLVPTVKLSSLDPFNLFILLEPLEVPMDLVGYFPAPLGFDVVEVLGPLDAVGQVADHEGKQDHVEHNQVLPLEEEGKLLDETQG